MKFNLGQRVEISHIVRDLGQSGNTGHGYITMIVTLSDSKLQMHCIKTFFLFIDKDDEIVNVSATATKV